MIFSQKKKTGDTPNVQIESEYHDSEIKKCVFYIRTAGNDYAPLNIISEIPRKPIIGAKPTDPLYPINNTVMFDPVISFKEVNIFENYKAGFCVNTLEDSFVLDPEMRSCNNNYSLAENCQENNSVAELIGLHEEENYIEHLLMDQSGQILLFQNEDYSSKQVPWILNEKYMADGTKEQRPLLVNVETNETYCIESNVFSIGIDFDRDLQILQAAKKHQVSRKHASIISMADGKVMVTDYSTNGTFIATRKPTHKRFARIPKNIAIELKNGMYVQFANVVFRFFISAQDYRDSLSAEKSLRMPPRLKTGGKSRFRVGE